MRWTGTLPRWKPGASMLDPIAADIGRRVIYRDPRGQKIEEGIITSFNPQYVFVRYGRANISAATRREDLEWSTRAPDQTVLAMSKSGRTVTIDFSGRSADELGRRPAMVADGGELADAQRAYELAYGAQQSATIAMQSALTHLQNVEAKIKAERENVGRVPAGQSYYPENTGTRNKKQFPVLLGNG